MSADNTLTLVDKLVMPNISGSVEVPLAELDRLRSEHASAVKLAKDLKDKWPMIIIRMITQHHAVKEYDRYDSGSRGVVKEFKSVLEDQHIDNYVNMEEIMDPLRDEIRKEFQKSLDLANNEKVRLNDKIIKLKKKASDKEVEILGYKETIEKKDSEIKENIQLLESTKKDLDEGIDMITNSNKMIDKMQAMYDGEVARHKVTIEALNSKSIWARIAKLFGFYSFM